MAAKYFALLTNLGAAKLSSMAALGEKLEITSMAVGDGGGVTPTPDQKQTKLVNEVRRAPLNSLSTSKNGESQIVAEQIIPDSAGGWWIREIGLYDAAGDLIAIANCPETYKATTEEGSGRTQVIRIILTVSSTDAVTLKVDPSVVLASRQYVDDAVIEVKNYSDDLMKAHLAEVNPHQQYLLIKNALKEIADAGLADEVLENLGLNEWRYPIGSYYENEVDSRNPSVILGFGVWEPRTGLLYGAGVVSDKTLNDSQGKPLKYEIAIGEVKGRLFVTQGNIASDYLSGSTNEDGTHEHDYLKQTGQSVKGGDTNACSTPSFTSTKTTGGGKHKHAVTIGIGKQTEPFMIPGFACYRWVRVE